MENLFNKFSHFGRLYLRHKFTVFLLLSTLMTTEVSSTTAVLSQPSEASEKILGSQVTRYGNTDFITKVVSDPKMVAQFSSKLGIHELASAFECPGDDNAFIRSGRKDVQHFGMGEFKISTNPTEFLYTCGLRDCIAVVIWDPSQNKGLLYHASKMEIRKNDFGERTVETYIVPEIKKQFPKSEGLKISLVATCYTQDLLDLYSILQQNGFRVSHASIPPIALESREWSNTIYVDETKIAPALLARVLNSKGLLNGAVILRIKDGAVGFTY